MIIIYYKSFEIITIYRKVYFCTNLCLNHINIQSISIITPYFLHCAEDALNKVITYRDSHNGFDEFSQIRQINSCQNFALLFCQFQIVVSWLNLINNSLNIFVSSKSSSRLKLVFKILVMFKIFSLTNSVSKLRDAKTLNVESLKSKFFQDNR